MTEQPTSLESGASPAPATTMEAAPAAPPTAMEGTPLARPTTIEGSASGAPPTRQEPPLGQSSDSPDARRRRRRLRLPPAITDRYDYEYDLATGAQATVTLCTERATDRQVAIKVYQSAAPELDQQLVARLNDADPDHVVPMELESWEDWTWEVQEYFPLGSLEDLVVRRGGCLPDADVRRVLTELTAAIKHIHERDVIHRDLKPQNILIRGEDPIDCVLGDFGVARELALASALSAVAGTYAYIAPEGTHGRLSRAGDWWALGVIVHRLLTGSQLFASALGRGLLPEQEIRASLAEGTYSFDDVTDPRWHLLLSGLLTFDRHDRWTADQVESWLAGESPEVAKPRTEVARPAPPFPFLDESYRQPAALALAMRKEWRAAGELLATRQSVDELAAWLHQTGVRDSADGALSAVRSNLRTPDRVLVELQLLMAPTEEPWFRGRPVSSHELSTAMSGAVGGDRAEQEWLKALREQRVLSTVGAHASDGGDVLLRADERLRIWWGALSEHYQRLAQLDEQQNGLLYDVWGELEGVLLAAALDDSQHERIRTQANVELHTGVPPWLMPLVPLVYEVEDVPIPAAALVSQVVPRARLAHLEQRQVADQAEADRLERERVAEEERVARQQETQRANEQAAREAARAAGRSGAKQALKWRLIWSAGICAVVGYFRGWGVYDDQVIAAAWTGVPLLVAALAAYAADRAVPQRRGSALSRLLAGYGLIAGVVVEARSTAVGELPAPAAWVLVAAATAAGYCLGSAIGQLLDDHAARLGRPTSTPRLGGFWLRLAVPLHVVAGLVGVAALWHLVVDKHPGLPTINDSWPETAAWYQDAVTSLYSTLPSALIMMDTPGWFTPLALATAATAGVVAFAGQDVGRLGPRVAAAVTAAVALAGLLLGLYALFTVATMVYFLAIVALGIGALVAAVGIGLAMMSP